MHWITDTIAIGNHLDALDAGQQRTEGIRSLLCLDGKLRGVSAGTLGLDALAVFELTDGPGNNPEIFQRAVETVARFSKEHPRLLVQCHAGRSRSVIVVAANLMRTRRWTTEEAVSFIRGKREIAITPGIEKLLHAPWLDER